MTEKTEKKTKRNRRVASAPQNVLGKCIEELSKLNGEERGRVLSALGSWFCSEPDQLFHGVDRTDD